MTPSRNTAGKAQPQNERSRGNPTRRRSPGSQSESREHTSCSSLAGSRKRGHHLDDESEEVRPRKRARRSLLSTTLCSTPSASNPAPSTSSSSTQLLLITPSLLTTLCSTSSASTEVSGDADYEKVGNASSDDVEDEAFSDTDDDKVKPSTTSTVPATETQTNQEIQNFLNQNGASYTVIDSTCYDSLGEDEQWETVKHDILARIRLPKKYGGTGKATEIEMLNDTGSAFLRLFHTDLEEMGYDCYTYWGHTDNITLGTGNGEVCRKSLWVELQLLKPDDKTPFGDWFLERATIGDMDLCMGRLTGSQVRNEFSFLTTPGNRHLYVAKVAPCRAA